MLTVGYIISCMHVDKMKHSLQQFQNLEVHASWKHQTCMKHHERRSKEKHSCDCSSEMLHSCSAVWEMKQISMKIPKKLPVLGWIAVAYKLLLAISIDGLHYHPIYGIMQVHNLLINAQHTSSISFPCSELASILRFPL